MLPTSPLRSVAALLAGALLGGCTVTQGVAPEREIAAFNVAVSSVGALGARAVRGKVRSFGDVAEALGAGAVGGLGFYGAKRLVGDGRLASGIALGYAAASVTENAAEGEHPLGAVRYGFGPLDVRARTPFARRPRPALAVEVNAVGALGLAVLPVLGYRPVVEGGTLVFRDNDPPAGLGIVPTRGGFALGRVVGAEQDLPAVIPHETIHALQSLQLSAITPAYRLRDVTGHGPGALDLQLDWSLPLLGLSYLAVPYRSRWSEVEAYTLVPDEGDCHAAVCPAGAR